MRAFEALETLELLGANQWGLVTTAQARAHGLSNVRLARLSDTGTLQRVRHGVYALPSSGSARRQDLYAAWLATDPKRTAIERLADAEPLVVAGESAAVVHQLGDVLPSQHQFVSAKRKQSSLPDVRISRRDLPLTDVTTVDGLPVTTVARTVADLVKAGIDEDHLREVLRDAIRSKGTEITELAAALEPRAKHYGYSSGPAVLEGLVPQVPTNLADLATQLAASSNVRLPPETIDALARLRSAVHVDMHAAAQNILRAIIPIFAELPAISADDLRPMIEAVRNAMPEDASRGNKPSRAGETESRAIESAQD